MNDPMIVDLFVEDRAHEEFLKPLIHRIAREEDVSVTIRIRSARGGHGRAISEYKLYQKLLEKKLIDEVPPEIIVVAIDANCQTFKKMESEILSKTEDLFRDCIVIACPDPHVERWYLADPQSFCQVVGFLPSFQSKKCKRDYYKNVLVQSIQKANVPVNLCGIEFASQLSEAMDMYRAGKNQPSLRSFIDTLREKIRQIARR